jgi:aryl-alcohol dehydrogenase-like predicted oxidoreductase
MIHRRLHRAGLDVSVIGFGCMSLGVDHAANARLIHRALDSGVNYFDTADLYQQGRNEVSLGLALRGRRHAAIVATKVGNQLRADGSGWDWNPRKAYVKQAVRASLERLKTNHIDLCQLHGGTIEDPIDETIEAFEELRQEGQIRHYGLSSIRPNVIAAWAARSQMVSVMVQHSLLDRRPEEQVLELLGRSGIGVVVRGAIAKGLLAGKPATEYLDHDREEVAAAQELLSTLAEPGTTLAQLAVRYCLACPGVTSVACGIRTEAQLEENLAAAELPPLSSDQLAALQAGAKASRYQEHRIAAP